MLEAIGSAISAGANIIGGLMGSNEKKKDRALQKEFAQQGIRWKVEDAKAAGLHPLAALGAQTMSYSPVSVGGSDIGTGLAAAGQDVSRAINATRGKGERLDAYAKTVQDLNLRRMGLENDLLASQIAKINQAGTPPALPRETDRLLVEGQGDSPLVNVKPVDQATTAPGQPYAESAANPEMGWARTESGWAPVQSKEFHDRAEEDFGATLGWWMRNRILPRSLGGSFSPPKNVPMAPGDTWIFDPVRQEYRLLSKRDRESPYGRW